MPFKSPQHLSPLKFYTNLRQAWFLPPQSNLNGSLMPNLVVVVVTVVVDVVVEMLVVEMVVDVMG